MIKLRPWLCLLIVASLFACGPALQTTRAADDDDKAEKAAAAQLEAIGGLSMVTARNTFLLIGVTADAFAKQAYKGDQVEAIMKSVIRQLDTVSNQLRKLQDAELSEANDQYVDQIVSVYRLLQDQARALDKFVAKPGEGTANAFEKARKAALTALDKLAGDDKEEEKKDEEDAEEK